jgi:hypothetical protein
MMAGTQHANPPAIQRSYAFDEGDQIVSAHHAAIQRSIARFQLRYQNLNNQNVATHGSRTGTRRPAPPRSPASPERDATRRRLN